MPNRPMLARSARGMTFVVLSLALLGLAVVPVLAQHQLPPKPPERFADALPPQPGSRSHEVGVLPVQGNVYMLNLGEVNIVAQVGEDGILLVDTGPAEWADAIVATLRERFGRRQVKYIINTHMHADHVGANAAIITAAGMTGGGGGFGGGNQTRVIAHENTFNRMSGVVDGEDELPLEGQPTLTFFTQKKELYFNGEPIEVLYQPAAHTDGDVMVWFRGSDVIAAGDLFSTLNYPVIDEKRGGRLQGHLDALNRMLDITVPRFNQMGGTMVVPGRGRLSNESDVDDYRNWMTIVRDRVRDMVAKGMTLEQVQAARPTLDFDGVFDSAHWTPERFLEVVYRDLSRNEGSNGGTHR